MRALIQRVTSASVSTEGEKSRSIEQGFCILLGVGPEDTEEVAEKLWAKILKLRIFEDENGKLNKALADVQGAVLVVPNFTIAGDCRKGNRPSFIKAERPERAVPLFELFKQTLAERGIPVQSGVFGADMQVSLVNDGPITLIVEKGDNSF